MKFIFKTHIIFCLTLIIFVALLFILPRGFISPDLGGTVLTITTFLFGIIAGFYIAVTAGDYNSVKNVLSDETGGLISLYQTVLVYDRPSAEKLDSLIDEYIRRQFDYEIMDYTKNTIPEFEKIKKVIQGLPVKQDQSSVYQGIISTLDLVIGTRQKMIVLGTKSLSKFQWGVLWLLAALVIVSLYGLRTGEIFFDIVAVAVSGVIILILSLIRDLDTYIWNEKSFGFDIFESVLLSINKLPYYPKESLEKKRIKPIHPEYRLGILLNPGKNLERRIEIIKK